MQRSMISLNSQYGRLIPLYLSDSDKNYKYYLCICSCGKYCEVKGSNLKSGHTQSCGCLKKEVSSKLCRQLNLAKGKKDMTFYHYTRNAKKRNIEFVLTEDQFNSIRKEDCTYCTRPGLNGIDRFDNTKGYTLKNSVACCKVCNKAKDVMSFQEFKSWIDKVYTTTKDY